VKQLEALRRLEDVHLLLPGCGTEPEETELFGIPLWDGGRLVLRVLSQAPPESSDHASIEVMSVRDG
jgi:hypothetical protein